MICIISRFKSSKYFLFATSNFAYIFALLISIIPTIGLYNFNLIKLTFHVKLSLNMALQSLLNHRHLYYNYENILINLLKFHFINLNQVLEIHYSN